MSPVEITFLQQIRRWQKKDCEEKMKEKEIALQAKHKPNPDNTLPLERLRRDIALGLASGQGHPAKSEFEKLMSRYRDPV